LKRHSIKQSTSTMNMKMTLFSLAVAAMLIAMMMIRVDAIDLYKSKDGAAMSGVVSGNKRFNEVKIMPGHDKPEQAVLPRPHEYIDMDGLPDNFSWTNVDGVTYVTKSLNQHIPQYCGSCWAHGAISALGDRIKIARGGKGVDINLAIQFILNCGTEVAGSCHGGSATGTYQFIHDTGYVPYDTCQQYAACSAESDEGNCSASDYTCKPMNVCRTCSTFSSNGGFCSALDTFPNATIAEYGEVVGARRMMAEIHTRGPIACGVDATYLEEYQNGVLDAGKGPFQIDHIISVVGWGTDAETGKKYWVVRNSWGEYWGELGYFRVVMGENQLGIEQQCSWATPKSFTEINYGCYEDGSNCVAHREVHDPYMKYNNNKYWGADDWEP